MKKKTKKTNSLFAKIVIVILTLFLVAIIISITLRTIKTLNQFPGDETIPYTRVQVLNGCGVNNLAYRVSLFLREKGFDVVDISDVKDEPVEKTIVIDRVAKDMRNAKRLAKVINCPNVTVMIDSTLFLETTIILGKDYKKYFSKKILERKIY